MKTGVRRERKVSRVLVMLEYGEGNPCNGEVFDLTALACELATKGEHKHARIEMEVVASNDYDAPRVEPRAYGEWPLKAEISWRASVSFCSSNSTAWLDDAVNAALPNTADSKVVLKAIRRTEKKLEALRHQLKDQRLMEAAEIRAKNPVCRITQSPLGLVEPGTANGELRTTNEGGEP